MMNKMTNAKALDFVLTNCTNLPSDVREKIEKMKEQVEKKNSAERKPTATQTANEGFKILIENFLSDGSAHTVSEIAKGVPELNEVSNQRVSAIIRQMVSDGILMREEVKRKAFFSLACEDEWVQALPRELEV